MLTIRPTKMLARRLGIGVPPVPPAVVNRVADWCAHEFKISRHRYLIFCNTASIYPVVMMASGVTDGPTLVARLMGGLQTCLRGGGVGGTVSTPDCGGRTICPMGTDSR